MNVRIGIIGGSGVYDPELFEKIESIRVKTPYGDPSSSVEIGEFKGTKIAFIPRHGRKHEHPPHMINYKANVWALKELGVERIISPCAVGSLKENYMPGDIVIPDQFIDFTKKRDYTFYNEKTVHISTADPFCPELSELFYGEALSLKIKSHNQGTYICIEGPRFSTRAESKMFRDHADIIGMTLVPECQLARELKMCYVSLAMITDYDVWAEKPVDIKVVMETMEENIENIKALLKAAIPKIRKERKCSCKEALKNAEV